MSHVETGSPKAARLKTNSDPESYSVSSLPLANPTWLFHCALQQQASEHLHVWTTQQQRAPATSRAVQEEITTAVSVAQSPRMLSGDACSAQQV